MVALGAGAAWVQVSTHRTHDAAAAELLRSIDSVETVSVELGEAAAVSDRAKDAASVITEAAVDGLVDATARTAFVEAAATVTELTADAVALLEEPVGPFPLDKPFWPWEIAADSERLAADTVDVRATGHEMSMLGDELTDADATLETAATAMYATAPAAASAIEAANISAKATIVLDLRERAAALATQERVGPGAASAFALYAQSAKDIVTSQSAEMAEKAGPLQDTRLEIEAFARSIAGGVVLDFDWDQTVAGIGGRDGMGGTATWNTGRGGFSTITLSHSVADNWPDANARALVAHEVGHSITSKCHTMFDSADQAANEEWATAWAISMGHTAEGNGVQAYGYPSQDMISRAAGCR